VNILGKNFFIPLTMAMPFLFLFILYYVESITEKDYKKFIFSISLLLLISLIHLPSFTILSIAAFFELIFNIGFITGLSRSNKIKGIFFLVIFFLFFSLLIWKGTFPETRSYIKDLSVFEKGWGKLEITYAVPLLYGIANTILVALGFIYFIFYSDSKIRLRFFIFLSFFSLAIIAMFNIFGFTILIPYSRAVHYAMLAMVPLTALGLSLIIEYLIQFQDIKKNKVLQILLKITIYSIFILCILLHKYDIDQNYRYYTFPVIDEYDFKALLWIKNNLGRDNLFVTPYFMTSAVYPISKNRVISLIPAQMEGGPMGENLNFTYFSCKDKKRVVDETGAQYILSQDKIECPYLKELYFDRDFIYEITSQK